MSNIITFYTATVPGNGNIVQLYQQMVASPPVGYTVMQHQSLDELCSQASKEGQLLQNFEIIAHGTPFMLGAMDVNGVAQFGGALRYASPMGNVFLSGCNTATWLDPQSKFSVSAYLGSLVTCKIYGTQGYVDTGTYAKGDINCSPDNWGQDKGLQYGGAMKASGFRVFTQCSKPPFSRYVIPYPAQTPIAINDPRLDATTRATLTNLISPLASMPNQNIPLNPKSGPTYCISSGADIYDFYIGTNAPLICREKNGYTWMLTPDASVMATLANLNAPVAAAAVVQQPEVPANVPN